MGNEQLTYLIGNVGVLYDCGMNLVEQNSPNIFF